MSSPNISLPFFAATDLARRLGPADAIAAIEQALRRVDPADDPPRSVISVAGGQMLLMPSADAHVVGVKVATVAPDNPCRELPRVQAVYVLFEAGTLRPAAVLDGAALTTLRTPAVSVAAIGPALRARSDAPRLVVFGAGPQAHGHVATLAAVTDLADVAFVTPDPRGRDRVLAAGSAEAEAVLRAADIVVCATTAREPLFDSGMLTDDVIVVAIGSHEPDARELDAALLARSQVIVEDVDTALRECGDVVMAIEEGALRADALVPMQKFVTGAVEPATDRPVVFKGSGMAWQDLAVADRIVHAAIG